MTSSERKTWSSSDFSTPKPLLRYPGGKSRVAKEIIKYFPDNIDRMCSPFIGGGSIELIMASRGVKVFGYDILEPLVSFWQAAIRDAKALAERVRKYYPLSKEQYYSLRAQCMEMIDKEEQAAVFFVLNRASFSGLAFLGMGSGRDFNLAAIERLSQFRISNLSVEKSDFHDSIARHSGDFLYLDPPYVDIDYLYGQNKNRKDIFDHVGLTEILKKREKWILSYNDCDLIRKLYKDFKIINLEWTYTMKKIKKGRELLIFSKDLT